MYTIRKILTVALCVYCLDPINIVFAESTHAPSKSIQTVTLLVKKYGDLEKALQAAILQNDMKKINTLLAPDFEERKVDNPNSPIPKEDWINLKLKESNLQSYNIQQIAVRELGNILIVSYLLVSDKNNAIFVVDVWKRELENSKLMARYSSARP